TAAPYPLYAQDQRTLRFHRGPCRHTPETVRRIFYWIDSQIPWAGALEYGVMPNIPEYVLTRRHGDCGMKTLLFMTLARYNGVPVKWQSGWMMHPGEVNLHDWCEVWYEGAGWVPLDMSFGRLPSANPRIRDFYMTGIDPWRLIVNDAVGKTFVPAKKYPRSEPVDFQRGEVEWRGGNLYFNRWSYRMSVEYL
ncbi:MAG TPA: transglutaminase-like domain-containing protein, partial [Prolixibacteraceae bacterium]|nr:transglutaminase-like domain-containing protein [Prolixibacteraceae bacterium]